MRITHITSGISPILGGVAVAVTELARAQRAAGLDVAIVSSFYGEADATGESLRDAGIDVTEIGPCKRPLQSHPSMQKTLEAQIARSDVVHIHALWEEIQHQGANIARAMGKPYIFTPHGMLDPWSLSQSRLKKRIYLALRLRKNLNAAVAIHYTSSIERDLAAKLNLTPPTILEPNGVDLKEFDHLPARGTFRASHPELADRPIVLFLSRIHPKKGLDLLIPAFAQAKIEPAMLVIAGPDSDGYEQQVRADAEHHGIADRVLFTGMLRGPARLEPMVDADLFVLPSYQENFGIVVAEALAAGCPVIISDQVNIHPDVSAAKVGEVVPTQVAPLATALRRWMSNSDLRHDAASRAPQFVRERYDWNQIARRWITHYTELRT